MTEELVTLEIAKLLKEKGFNEYCENVIDDNGVLRKTLYRTNNYLPKVCYSRPTQTIVAKWLRETKNVHICILIMLAAMDMKYLKQIMAHTYLMT